MKKVPADSPRYRLKPKAPMHFINSRRYKAGAEFAMHPDIRPNKWMEEVVAVKPEKPDKPGKSNTKAE